MNVRSYLLTSLADISLKHAADILLVEVNTIVEAAFKSLSRGHADISFLIYIQLVIPKHSNSEFSEDNATVVFLSNKPSGKLGGGTKTVQNWSM